MNIGRISLISPISRIFHWFTATRRRKILSITLISLITLTSLRFIFLKPREVQAADVYLGFDEGYGTTSAVNDTNGTVSAGSITNAVWKAEDLCKVGKCLYFDGTGDYVSFADDANLDMAASDNVTVEAWFRTPDISSGTRTLVSKEEATGADGGYRIEMNSSGQIRFGIDSDNDTFPLYFVTSSSAYDNNKWHHIAAVKDGTSTMTLYLDGQSVGTTSITSTDASNADSFYIGSYFDVSASNGFSGFIDEVKVLRIARTAAEIKADYAGETPSRGTSASFGPDQSWLSQGLVGYWKMDEASWTVDCATDSALDSSGNGIHGDSCPTSTGPAGGSSGKFGNTGNFDGTEDYVSIGAYNKLDNATSTTLSAWVKPSFLTTDATNRKIFSNNEYSIFFLPSIDDMRFTLETGGVSTLLDTQGLTWTVDTWHLMTAVYDGQNMIIYWDGQELVRTAKTGTVDVNTSQTGIGAQAGGNNWYGGIDEVRIYTRALSPVEIQSLYNWAPGPVGYWKLDEATGTTTNDSSGNGNISSAFTGNTSWTSGKFGSGLTFDGTDDVARIVETTSTDLGATTDSYTVSAWIKTSAQAPITNSYIVAKADGATPYPFILYLNTSEYACFALGNGVTIPITCNATALNDDKWHYITGVRNVSTDTVYIYIDGVYANSTTDTTTATTVNSDDISIGNGGASYVDSDFTGVIDDVHIYNYARSPSQIIEDMNAGHPAPGSPVGSAVAHWKFDEGSLNTCSGGANDFCDYIDNSHDLVFSTTTGGYSTSGKFGKAYNGADNVRATLADDPDFDFSNGTDDFTLSLWFNRGGAISAQEYLLDKHATNDGYTIYMDSDGDIVCGIGDGAAAFPEETIGGTLSKNYDDTSWHHAVCVKLGTSSLRLYVDGIEITSDTSLAVTDDMSNSGKLIIGDTDEADGTDEWLGDIDETKIFRSALTAAQIKVLYSQSSGTVWGAKSTSSTGGADWSNAREYCPPGDTGTCNAPVLEWKLDENTGTTSSYDTSGNGYTGTLQGTMTTEDWVPGKFGSALDFDGSDDYVNNDTRIINAYPFTLEAWIKISTTGVTRTIISLTDNGSSPDVVYAINVRDTDGTARTRADDGPNGSGNGPSVAVTDGKWHYVVAVFTSTTATLYLDGGLYSSSADISTVTYGAGVNSVSVGSSDLFGVDSSFPGVIDHARVYDYSRTPAQIAWSFNLGEPVLRYKLDECSGTVANNSADYTGDDPSLDGTITIGAGGGEDTIGNCTTASTSWGNGATGKRNASLDLDGTDDYVETADNDGLNFLDGKDMTIAGWFNRDTATTDDVILAKRNGLTNDDAGYIAYIDDATDKLTLEVCDGGIDCNEYQLESASTFTATGWNHFIIVWDDDSESGTKMYINGIEENVTRTGTFANIGNVSSAVTLRLGSESDGTAGTFFDGKLDDIQLFRYALTAQQIKNIYSQGAVRFGP